MSGWVNRYLSFYDWIYCTPMQHLDHCVAFGWQHKGERVENGGLRQGHFARDKGVLTLTNSGEGETSGVRVANVAREAIEASPGHSMRLTLCSSLGSESFAGVAEACSDDRERLCREGKLGCARCVFWVLVFQAGAAVVVAVCWSLHILGW
jgi:hypothetical protein